MFQTCKFSREIELAAEVAITVGRHIRDGTWSTEVRMKDHPTFGTSSVSDADEKAQALAKEMIESEFPHAIIVGEEQGEGHALSFETIRGAPLVYYLDLLDGSTSHEHDNENWSDSIGVMQHGRHTGGAIFAPDILGELLTVGESGKGTFLWQRGSKEPKKLVASELRVPKKPVVCLGLDVQRSSNFHLFISAMSKTLRPRDLAPSGALGLAKVAAGKYDCIVQSPQMPWDTFGGLPQVIEAGWRVQYYVIEDGKIILIPDLTPECYRIDKQVLGLIAGRPEIVEELTPLLVRTFGSVN